MPYSSPSTGLDGRPGTTPTFSRRVCNRLPAAAMTVVMAGLESSVKQAVDQACSDSLYVDAVAP